MEYIQHRINNISNLYSTEPEHGIEVDLRISHETSSGIKTVHDPWLPGDDFVEWVTVFKKLNKTGTLILNTKDDGLEAKILETLHRLDIHNFFFLDTQLPTMIKWLKQGENRFAWRVSAYEALFDPSLFPVKPSWLWVDCFNGVPLNAELLIQHKNFCKICLVSPELQGIPLDKSISNFSGLNLVADAVCTKDIPYWQNHFKL